MSLDYTTTIEDDGRHYWCRCGLEIHMPDMFELKNHKMCIMCFTEKGGFNDLSGMSKKNTQG